MSQRDRKGTGVIAAAPATVAAGLLRRSAVDAAPDRLILWEDLFRHASPEQRDHLLDLAKRQGFLYAHQVPTPTNGKKPIPGQDHAPAAEQLKRLLEADDLPPVRPQPLMPWDQALDRLQREAVARAVDTPDVALIAGLPGTGKSRVVAEILTQAAQRGQRVLFLAPRTGAIDPVLEQIGGRDVLFPLRCMEAGERPELLTPLVRSMTFAERVHKMGETVPGALQGKEAAEQRCQRRRNEETVWPALRDLAGQGENLARRREELRQQQARVPGEVSDEAARIRAEALETSEVSKTSEACPFATELLAEERRHQETLAEITTALNQVEKTEADSDAARIALEAEVQKLKPLALAKQRGRWWTFAWWRATFRGNVIERLAEAQQRLEETSQALAGAREEGQSFHAKRRELEQEHQQALKHLLKKEVDRRQTDLAVKETALDEAGRQLDLRWHAQIELLDREGARPAMLTTAAVDLAFEHWQARCRQDEESRAFAQQWADTIQEAADTLAQRLPALANVVAGTMAGFLADKHFASSEFDLLLVEDAHKIGEAEFLKLAGHARRWVLVGEPPWELVNGGVVNGGAVGGNGSGGTPHSPLTTHHPLFHRLWRRYNCDLRALPYAWAAEGERLCCRLKPIRPEHRQWLECERVADCPEIELRIVTLPGESPVLAEVVFPPSFSIEQAKGFIFKELDELAIQSAGRHGCWLEDADRFLFHMGQDTNGPATMVPLEAGVREGVHSRRTTCGLEFDRAAGWNRDSVASWLKKRLGLTDIGRAITLVHPYRMQPELAAILTDLLFGEHMGAGSDRNGQGNGAPRPLIFVPVPSLRKRTVSAVLPKEGAGLELDLTATRGGDRLPAELRAALPGRGIVNYYEAQALVRHLEKLVQDPAVAKAAIPGRPAIGVVALYAGQVELIRLLCRRSPILSKSSVAIEIGLPADHCHREFPLVLCSLTRSHNFRAVSLGEDASALILALTRARTRLMVFGDPGTLVRRSHWQGRLDHLDEHAASREAQCVGHLVHYLKGQGTFAWAFHVDTDER